MKLGMLNKEKISTIFKEYDLRITIILIILLVLVLGYFFIDRKFVNKNLITNSYKFTVDSQLQEEKLNKNLLSLTESYFPEGTDKTVRSVEYFANPSILNATKKSNVQDVSDSTVTNSITISPTKKTTKKVTEPTTNPKPTPTSSPTTNPEQEITPTPQPKTEYTEQYNSDIETRKFEKYQITQILADKISSYTIKFNLLPNLYIDKSKNELTNISSSTVYFYNADQNRTSADGFSLGSSTSKDIYKFSRLVSCTNSMNNPGLIEFVFKDSKIYLCNEDKTISEFWIFGSY